MKLDKLKYTAERPHGYSDSWRLEPDRPRPLGYGWRLRSTGSVPALPVADSKPLKMIIEAIAADAIMSAHCYPKRRVSYSRGQEWWQKQTRYCGEGWTRDNVIAAVDLLVDTGILVSHNRKARGPRGLQSSYLPSPVLTVYEIPILVVTHTETIILRDEDHTLKPYKDSDRTIAARKLVERVNRRLSSAQIEIRHDDYTLFEGWFRKGGEGAHVFPDRKTLCRIFSGGWTLGGRFYAGWWQQVSGDDRQYIFVDGERTEEVDYASIHPRILYSWEHAKMDGDPYSVPGWENERKLCKIALNTILNAPTYKQALGAIAREMAKDTAMAEQLIAAIKARHPVIAKHFHTGVGIRLQYLDAQMCSIVLTELTVKRDIVVLPVHDSFVVSAEHRELLVRVMKDAYETVAGKVEDREMIVKSTATRTVVESKACVNIDNIDPLEGLKGTTGGLCLSSLPSVDNKNQESVIPIILKLESAKPVVGKQESDGSVIAPRIAGPFFIRQARELEIAGLTVSSRLDALRRQDRLRVI